MSIKNIAMGAIASLSLVSMPAMAQATQAVQKANAVERTAIAPVTSKKANLNKGLGIVPLVLALGVIAGAVILAVNNDEDKPTSP